MGVEVLVLKVLPIVHRPDRPQSQLPGGLQMVGLAPEPLGSAVFYDYALKFIQRQRMDTDIVENLPDLSRLTRGIPVIPLEQKELFSQIGGRLVIPVEIVPGERISAAVTAHLHARRIIEIGQIISGRGSAFGTDPQYDEILFHRVIGAVQVPDLRIGEILSGPAPRLRTPWRPARLRTGSGCSGPRAGASE